MPVVRAHLMAKDHRQRIFLAKHYYCDRTPWRQLDKDISAHRQFGLPGKRS